MSEPTSATEEVVWAAIIVFIAVMLVLGALGSAAGFIADNGGGLNWEHPLD